MKGINLFLAYAPEDEEYREKIGKHLSVLKERGFLQEFCLSKVSPGANADLEIRTMMSQAKIILLLISADFLASDECQRLEDLAFSMKMRNDAVVVPVLLRPCLYDESYDQLEMLPGNKKSVSDTDAWGNEDAALTRVAERIRDLAVKIKQKEAAQETAEKTSTTVTVTVETTTPSTTHVVTPDPIPPPRASSPTTKPSESKPISYRKALFILPLLLIGGLVYFGLSYFNKKPTKIGNAIAIQKDPIKNSDPIPAEPALFTVPNFKGKSWVEVAQRLEKAGIKNLKRYEVMSCTAKAGIIATQNPKAGSKIAKDAEMKFEVVRGPKKVNGPSIGSGGLKILKNGQRRRQAAWAFKSTNVVFSLFGTECSKGKITVDHPLGGTKVHNLKAGQKGNNSRFFGLGDITVTFSSDDPAARLRVRIY